MLKNHYVNRAPYRTASISEDPTTGQVSIELTSDGELKEVQLLGEGLKAMAIARMTGVSWARHGVSDPTYTRPESNKVRELVKDVHWTNQP